MVEERRSCWTGTERDQMEWDVKNYLGKYREDRDERTSRIGMGIPSAVLRLRR